MPTIATKSRVKAARLFHALSDETRLEILERLQEGEQCVCDLMDALQTAQSRLSFHLKVLKEAGLILDRPDGRWVYYALNQETVSDLRELVDALRPAGRTNRSSARCG